MKKPLPESWSKAVDACNDCDEVAGRHFNKEGLFVIVWDDGTEDIYDEPEYVIQEIKNFRITTRD